MKKLCLFLFTCLLLLAGCTNNIQTMLDDYNENFAVIRPSPLPIPGDDDFDEREMLMAAYYVSSNDTFNVCAPYDCSSYTWIVSDPENDDEEIDITMFIGYSRFQREFVTYIPDSGLEEGKTYKLTLIVTDREGNEYFDISSLVIYHYYLFEHTKDNINKPDNTEE